MSSASDIASNNIVRGAAVVATGACLATIYPEEKFMIGLVVLTVLGASIIQSQQRSSSNNSWMSPFKKKILPMN